MWRIFRWFRSCVTRPYVRVDDSDDDETFVIAEEDFDDI